MLDQIMSEDLDNTLVEISAEQVEDVSGGFFLGLILGGLFGFGGCRPVCPPPKPAPCYPKPSC